jgi:hypothetical protein
LSDATSGWKARRDAGKLYVGGGDLRVKRERDDAAPGNGRHPEGRLPYEKPAVAWEQPLEAQPSLMSGCQKLPGQSIDCDAVSMGFS